MKNDVAAACAAQPIDRLLQRLGLSCQSVSFVVCDYFRSVFNGLLRPRYARICFATPVETKDAPR